MPNGHYSMLTYYYKLNVGLIIIKKSKNSKINWLPLAVPLKAIILKRVNHLGASPRPTRATEEDESTWSQRGH